jgi:hypothetical protein
MSEPKFRPAGALLVRNPTRDEQPPADGYSVRVEFADGTCVYVHASDVASVRRRVIKAAKVGATQKLPDGRWITPERARRVVDVRPATEEAATMPNPHDPTSDCRRGPRWWHGRQRRAQVARSDVRLTDPEGARREPDAARARRGQAALEALVRELRERS